MASTNDPSLTAQQARNGIRVAFYRLLIVTVVYVVFSPAKEYGFVNWDDPVYIIHNSGFQQPLWPALKWAFTHYHLGHYQPLNWLGFAINYAIVGLDPQRLHLSQIILHIVAALCVHQLARRLLPMLRLPTSVPAMEFAAAMATLVFAVHPLRVESVVWLCARADILTLTFACLSTLSYLRHASSPRGGTPWFAFVWFAVAVLTKVHAVVLPVVFVLLDWYPLRRIRSESSIKTETLRGIWLEKLPFLLVSVAASLNAFSAAGTSVATLEKSPIAYRVIQIPFSVSYYLLKSIFPARLSPFYEFPGDFGAGHPWVILSMITCGVIMVVLYACRRRSPGLLIVALAYFVILSPVSGIAQRGPQLAADRYSYLPCIPLALLAGAVFHQIAVRSALGAWCAACFVIITLCPQTMLQATIWRNSESLWRSAIKSDDHNAMAWAMLAHAHMDTGHSDDAIREFETALRIRSTQPLIHRNLAALYSRQGRLDDAIRHYEADIAENPNDASAHYFLGTCYERHGDFDRASKAYRASLDRNPNFAPSHLALAQLFLNAGYLKEAEPRLRRVLDLDPHNAAALELLAQICANTGRVTESTQLYDRAIGEAERRHQLDAMAKLRTAQSHLPTSAPSP